MSYTLKSIVTVTYIWNFHANTKEPVYTTIQYSSIGTFCTQSQQLLLPAQGCVADPE